MPSTLDRLIELAIEEDIGTGDITTEAIVPPDQTGTGVISAKQELVVAGLKAAEKVFAKIDSALVWEPSCEDGDILEDGEVIAVVGGSVASLLASERIALNFLQHLSGVATFTRIFADIVRHTRTKILDTRKTRPGYRELEKEAVRLGDGENHRMGLFDRYLIKNNHISVAGSIPEAVRRIRTNQKPDTLIEVEAGDVSDVQSALDAGADIIMLDNFTVSEVSEAVRLVKGGAKLEVSGNISLDNIKDYAKTGVDFISIGAITHSAPVADIHMLIE